MRKKKDPANEIDIPYPKFLKSQILDADKVNEYISARIDSNIAAYKVAQKTINLQNEAQDNKSLLSADVEIGIMRPDFISFRWRYYRYIAGTAHPNHWSEVVNISLNPYQLLSTNDFFITPNQDPFF